LDNISELIGVTIEKLEEICCWKFIISPVDKTKRIAQEVPVEIARFNRDTLAKHLYCKMFDWIVDRVNTEIKKPLIGGPGKYKSIGLLDIFGFEIFEDNSFE
jgi:myosin heavy subunit